MLIKGVIVYLCCSHDDFIFHIPEEEIKEDESVLAHVLERQISYFSDAQSLAEFLEIANDSPWAEVSAVTRDGFNAQIPCKPFSLWKGVSSGLKDLVTGLTNVNLERSFTAREALDHPWSKDL